MSIEQQQAGAKSAVKRLNELLDLKAKHRLTEAQVARIRALNEKRAWRRNPHKTQEQHEKRLHDLIVECNGLAMAF